MIDRRTLMLAGPAAWLSGWLAGCGPREPGPGKTRSLRIGLSMIPDLDPHRARLPDAELVTSALFKGLVSFDGAGSVVPALARSWNVAEDGLTYTFRLRPAQWSDGRAITARDFERSFARAFDPRSGNPLTRGLAAIAAAIASARNQAQRPPMTVHALTDTVLQLRLTEPLPALLGLLAHPALALTPDHVIRRHGRRWTDPDRLVVNGPYKPVAWSPASRMELVPNPAYWNPDAAQLDRIVLMPVHDTEAAFGGFRDGQLDLLHDRAVPFEQLDAAQRLHPGSLRLEPAWALTGYVLNARDPALVKPTVRRALAMALDRTAITAALPFAAALTPTAALIPDNLPSYGLATQPDWWTWPVGQRLAEARRLLAEAGFSAARPLDVTVLQATGTAERAVFTLAALQWARIDIRSRAMEMAPDRLDAAIDAGDFSLAWQHFSTPVDMPEAYLARMLCGASPLNVSGYCNPEVDRVLASAFPIADVARRALAFRRAEELLGAETPLISLYAGGGCALVAPRVTGWIGNPAGRHPLDRLGLDAETP